MRKLIVIAMLVAASSAPARADVGLGVFVGEPTGLDLKIGLGNRSGLDLLFGWDTILRDGRNEYGHITYLATLAVAHGSSVSVPIRLGIGAAIYDDGTFNNGVNVAARAPLQIGFRFHGAPVEIYGEISLLLTFVDPHDNNDTIDLDGGVGFRVYF